MQKLYGNRAMSVELPCSLQTVIVWSLCGFRAEAARRWCGDRGATVPFLSTQPPHGARAGIMRCHLRHVYGLQTYDFSNLYNFPLHKIVETAEPVNPYKNLTDASCLHMEASRRPHGKGVRAGYGLSRPIAGQMWTRHKKYTFGVNWVSNSFSSHYTQNIWILGCPKSAIGCPKRHPDTPLATGLMAIELL